MHLSTDAEIDRSLSVGELIVVNTNAALHLRQHYHAGSEPFPPRLMEPADRESWRPFDLEDARALPGIGRLLSPLLDQTHTVFTRQVVGLPTYPRWRPAVFAMVGPTEGHTKDTDAEGTFFEVGLGAAHYRSLRTASGEGSFAVTMRHEELADGTTQQQLRLYTGANALKDCVHYEALPVDYVSYRYLQMQRDAMWNMNYEPA